MKRFLWTCVVLAAAAPALAAVTVTAELSRDRVAIDDQLALSVTVNGDQASLPSPRLPPISDFSVYDSGRSQSLSFVNGRVSASVVYTYVLTPRAIGKFKIPPITADGASAPTPPLDVEVVKAGTPPPPAAAAPVPSPGPSAQPGAPPEPTARPSARQGRTPEAFVTASVDKPRAYVNQQITLTVRFLTAIQLIGDLRYEAPSLTGFLSEELPPVRNGMTTIGGRPYQYSEIKVALFPLQPGKLTIGSAAVHGQVPRFGGSPQDFFDRFFAMAAPQPLTVHSEPLTVQVEPLPAGKTDDFTGVVGRLSAKVSADRTDVKAGDAVTLAVAVSGVGNLKSVPEPKKPDLPSLRFFETESAATTDKANDRVGGTKTFKTVVVPRVSGSVRVPPFTFSYFDPERKAYVRAQTSAVDLRVAPGAGGAAAAMPAPSSAPGVTTIADDIRYLKTSPRRAPLSNALAAFADLGPGHALPFAVLLACALLAWRRRAAEADPAGRRFREALSRAEAKLKEAAALPDSAAARAAALADDALAGFVADKLGVPSGGLTLRSAVEGLKALKKAPSEETLRRLGDAWEEADLRRFAPGAAGDARRFAEETAALLKSLDQEVR